MHHEKEVSEAVKAMMADRVGPTGRFPGGKLTSNDEGEIAFAVGTLENKVVVNFGVPIASLAMSPRETRQLAALLFERAKDAEQGQRRKTKRRRQRRRPTKQ